MSRSLRIRTSLSSVLLAAVLSTPMALAGDLADNLTFYRDVLPIMQENCQACHRPFGLNLGGMVAPMALTDYADVRPWAKAIARVVSAREMPPWHATAEFNGVFSTERTLTDEEIATLVHWARSGAARGNPADGPAPIAWGNAEWRLGEPDLIVSIPEPYFVEDDVEDQYISFTATITREMLPEPRYIRASEARGGSAAVHHIIARPLGGMAPGGGHKEYPEGYGALLTPGTEVRFNMHYHKEPGAGTGGWDQSKVAVWFHDPAKPVYHEVTSRAVGNRTFEVPPGHPNWKVGASMIFAEDTTILALVPHMHLRGKDAKYIAFYPDGSQEVLLEVPNYDFNWQTRYAFVEPKQVPAGTRIQFEAHFDNSVDNESNPNPNVPVRFGGPTTAEMMLGFMTSAPTKPSLPATGATAGGR